MPLKIVYLRPQNWSRLKPYYSFSLGTLHTRHITGQPEIITFQIPKASFNNF